MADNSNSKAQSNNKNTRKQPRSEETRHKITSATLALIQQKGMRAVRHRAVAERADVPLGATTYHFNNLEDLISSAFEQWRSGAQSSANPYVQEIAATINSLEGKLINNESDRHAVATLVYQHSLDYILDQIKEHHGDRVIELAFYHEALQSEKLRLLVLDYWKNDINWLSALHQALGSPYPQEDAQISLSLFLRLENEAIMSCNSKGEVEKIKATLKRHIGLCCGVDLGVEQEVTL